MQGPSRESSHDSKEEDENGESSVNSTSQSDSVAMSTSSSTPTLPGAPPPIVMYAGPGGIQGTFCAMPFPSVPFTSASSSLPLMPLPQMLYTPSAVNPYGSQHIPLLGAGAFLYPQFASQATYLSALQGKRLTSPPLTGHSSKSRPSEDEEGGSEESSKGAEVARVSPVVSSPQTQQAVVVSQKQSVLYSMTTECSALSSPQVATADGQASNPSVPTPSPSGDSKSISMEPPSPRRSSVISRLLTQKSKHPLGTGQKSKTLEQLLTGTSKLEEESLSAEVQDEPHFVNFCRFFAASTRSSQLRLRILKTEGSGVLKWIEVSRKASHIDPSIGPVDVARILISSNGLCKLQLLFPYFTTVFTRFMPISQREAEELLSELSTNHVLCPGLPDYQDKYAVLGYHPSHVRVLETSSLRRYDHEKCPLWHVPSNLFSKSGHLLHNMCRYCRSLQGNLVRQAMKACEIDPQERESWTDPSSHRPLAFMSPADKEERYRKLRQERTQLLARLRMYEEQLGVGESHNGEGRGKCPSLVGLLTCEISSGQVAKGYIMTVVIPRMTFLCVCVCGQW